MNENHQVIRTYTPQATSSTYSTRGTESTPSAEDILEAMGLEQSFIDNMRLETLAVIQNSDYITTIVSYTKTDVEGNTSYISEEYANAVIEIIETMKENNSATTYAYGEEQDYDEDEYMRIWHMAVHDTTSEEDGTYIFSAAGRWLNMPFIRAWDAIGSSAQNCTYTPYTGYGYTQNDIVHFLAGGNVTSIEQDVVTPISPDDYKDTNNNGWVGAAAVFNLPNDDI